MDEQNYRERLQQIHRELEIPEDYEQTRGLPLQFEALELVSIGNDLRGRERHLAPEAAQDWNSLLAAAAADGVEILLLSAFRSVENQAGEIQRRKDLGEPIDRILTLLAAPGYSEHHTGRAVDITCPGIRPLDAALEQTRTFSWLMENAGKFHFSPTYLRDNPFKIQFEPWHWCWNRRSS